MNTVVASPVSIIPYKTGKCGFLLPILPFSLLSYLDLTYVKA